MGRIAWLGPGFLWMVSAAGSGELLFTPRVAAQYGYALLWALLAAVLLKWFVNHEVGRFAVVTGTPILEGFRRLPGPRHWALWILLVPQLVVAVTTVAGMAASAATALVLLLPGSVPLWTTVLILGTAAFVFWGRYHAVERAALVFGVAIAVAAVAAMTVVFPGPGALVRGLVPRVPPDLDYGEVLPWLGFLMAGAAGLMWYSYWLPAKGYGAAGAGQPVRPERLRPEGRRRLRGWLGQMTLDNSVAVVGTLIPLVAFLILGAELLGPAGVLPEEENVAEVLGRLLGDVWGPVGFWLMIGGILIGFWDTLLSVQDGFARLFGHGTRLLLPTAWRVEQETLQRGYLIGLVTVAPIALFLLVGQPVGLLQIVGAIEAAQIPLVAVLTLVVNHRLLPADLRPPRWILAGAIVAALFFAVSAGVYLARLAGVGG
jgi:Mn2+/Fe2+ NRAMP family transporter